MTGREQEQQGEHTRDLFTPGATIKDYIGAKKPNAAGLEPVVLSMLPEWHRRVIPKAKELLTKPPIEFTKSDDPDRADIPPHRIIDMGDAMVHIVGVVHSVRGNNSSRSEYGMKIKEYVIDTARKDGYVWATEQGIDRDFDVAGYASSIKDQTDYYDSLALAKKNETDDHTEKRRFLKKTKQIAHVVKTVGKEIFNLAYTYTPLQNPELRELITPTMKQTDMHNNLLRKKLIEETKLPEPLDMEACLVLTNEDQTDKPSLIVDRSYIQARRLEDVVQQALDERPRRVRDAGQPIHVGLLTGFLHASQIEYFLQHPDYDPHKSLAAAKQLIQSP